MTAVDTGDRIPNNVDLSGDRRLQRALEAWQPQLRRLVESRWGPSPTRTTTSTSAPRSRSARTAGPTSTT